MEQPDTWDCDNEAVQQGPGENLIILGNLSCKEESDISTPKSIPNNQPDYASPTKKILMEKDNGKASNPESVQKGEAMLNETDCAEDSQAAINGISGLSEQHGIIIRALSVLTKI